MVFVISSILRQVCDSPIGTSAVSQHVLNTISKTTASKTPVGNVLGGSTLVKKTVSTASKTSASNVASGSAASKKAGLQIVDYFET